MSSRQALKRDNQSTLNLFKARDPHFLHTFTATSLPHAQGRRVPAYTP